MAKTKMLEILAWVVGVLVTLAVGFGMTSKALVIPYIPSMVVVVAGWLVVIGAIVSVIMAIMAKLK